MQDAPSEAALAAQLIVNLNGAVMSTNTLRSLTRNFIALGLACATITLADTASENIVVPFEELPLPQLKPEQVAVGGPVWKDPTTGAWSELIRFKGKTGYHYHTFDYQLVVIKGTVSHWTERMPDAAKKKMTPGSYWFQPKNQVHEDTCLVDECIMFMNTLSGGETKAATRK